VRGDISIDSETLLVTEFINLKLAQSFRDARMDRMYVCVFIRVSARTCMDICIFLKKKSATP
jgi:hypothetical protein